MGYKILIAEDDGFLATAYRVKLVKEGFDLQIASDGEEALNILKTFVPDVIVLDLVMPRKDGFATLEEIRKQPIFKDIPIIVASNLGQQDDIDRAMALGAQDFITKSNLSMSDLITKLNNIAAASKK